ncbi:MAG: NRDE family protein [Pseudomonadota bacterium]
MCLIFVAYQHHTDYPLIIAANRDEFYARPTAPAAIWEDSPGILAGRDLKAMGTWLGVTATGRFAAVTNVREGSNSDAPQSRGDIVADFLRGGFTTDEYFEQLELSREKFNGYNLLAFDGVNLGYFSNCGHAQNPQLNSGLYGLSNGKLDEPWPKVAQGKIKFESVVSSSTLNSDALISAMLDGTEAPDEDLPDTGVGIELERRLAPMFIESPNYGTRSTTVVMYSDDGQLEFVERSHAIAEQDPVTRRFQFELPVGPELVSG